jgi:hypothetical protein
MLVCVRLVVGDAILGVLNKGVIFAANRRIEQNVAGTSASAGATFAMLR